VLRYAVAACMQVQNAGSVKGLCLGAVKARAAEGQEAVSGGARACRVQNACVCVCGITIQIQEACA